MYVGGSPWESGHRNLKEVGTEDRRRWRVAGAGDRAVVSQGTGFFLRKRRGWAQTGHRNVVVKLVCMGTEGFS